MRRSCPLISGKRRPSCTILRVSPNAGVSGRRLTASKSMELCITSMSAPGCRASASSLTVGLMAARRTAPRPSRRSMPVVWSVQMSLRRSGGRIMPAMPMLCRCTASGRRRARMALRRITGSGLREPGRRPMSMRCTAGRRVASSAGSTSELTARSVTSWPRRACSLARSTTRVSEPPILKPKKQWNIFMCPSV